MSTAEAKADVSSTLPAIEMDAKARRAAKLIRRHERRKLKAGELYSQADDDLKKAAALIGANRVVELTDGKYAFIQDQFKDLTEVWAHAAARRWALIAGDLGAVARKLDKLKT